MQAATALTEGRRSAVFNHQKAVAEFLHALSWMVYTGPNCGTMHIWLCLSACTQALSQSLCSLRCHVKTDWAAIQPGYGRDVLPGFGWHNAAVPATPQTFMCSCWAAVHISTRNLESSDAVHHLEAGTTG